MLHGYTESITVIPTVLVGVKAKRLLVRWWLESFFRHALLHYRRLTPSAHIAGMPGMCPIELNGMWRIGHPRSGNFHCKWLPSHQGHVFIWFNLLTNTHNQDCFQTFGIRQKPCRRTHRMLVYILPKCLQCRFFPWNCSAQRASDMLGASRGSTQNEKVYTHSEQTKSLV